MTKEEIMKQIVVNREYYFCNFCEKALNEELYKYLEQLKWIIKFEGKE